MNIRKSIDYTELYEALDGLMTRQLPQMELYCGIGKAVCRRREKGAAVMASEYLNQHYTDVKGFSPRSLRRMRDFYRTYEGRPSLLSRAMKLGWTLNVVIMEADLTIELREWYMKATEQFGWSKSELVGSIAADAHKRIILAFAESMCKIAHNTNEMNTQTHLMQCREPHQRTFTPSIIKDLIRFRLIRIQIPCRAIPNSS